MENHKKQFDAELNRKIIRFLSKKKQTIALLGEIVFFPFSLYFRKKMLK
jgi:hypothetical protein